MIIISHYNAINDIEFECFHMDPMDRDDIRIQCVKYT